MQVVSVGSTRGEANFHLVFTPKYRRDMFRDEEVKRMRLECFARTCYELGIQIQACEFGPDHVHLFVSGCKNYSVRQMVQRLKRASAHRIRHELWEHVKGKLWGDSFWSDGYFYRSVGSTTAEAVKFYVEHAQTKHWMQHDYETEQQERGGGQARLDEF